MDIQKRTLKNGITLCMLPDKKFKNSVIGIYFHMPLAEEKATALALLPKMLTAGNSKFSDRSALHLYLEELYGTKLHTGVEKSGEMQTVYFVADSIADAYAGEPLFEKMQNLLSDIILSPRTEGEGFDAAVLTREKEALLEDIRGIVNDKRRYALVRCAEEMCKGEPYAIRADGREEDLPRITPESAYQIYREMLSSARVDIFVSGNFEEAAARSGAERLAEKLGARSAEYPGALRKTADEVRYVEDKEAVLQGKLVIGYRVDVDPSSDDMYALMLYNRVFGGGTASKLFNNVREKMSLCYYASSGLERAKGLMFVQSGISFSKYAVALEAIRAEEAEIRKGNITDAEFSGAVQGAISDLRACKDSPSQLMGYHRRQLPFGDIIEIDRVIDKILAVRKEDVAAVAGRIFMDTVYFLNGKGGKEV